MINLKNISVGFLVSFLGSIPLGYLNIVGYKIYSEQGIDNTLFFLLGVIFIEFFVIYFTLIFADRLAANKKLTKMIEGFSVVFMFVLAYVFYAGATKSLTSDEAVSSFTYWSAFTFGLFLSVINFVQLPFWTGWNLYLLNGNYIEIFKSGKYFYVFGTVLGTFAGMLTLILSLHYLASQVDFLANYLMKYIISAVFVGLGILQAIKFYSKYRK